MKKSKELILQIRNIHKSFGENEVLKGISFDVFKGETKVIIGPSGMGKSTLAVLITNKLRELHIDTIFVDDGCLPIDHDYLKDADRLKDEIYVEVLAKDI